MRSLSLLLVLALSAGASAQAQARDNSTHQPSLQELEDGLRVQCFIVEDPMFAAAEPESEPLHAPKLSGSDTLVLHNKYRSYHADTPDLVYDAPLEASARGWAEHLVATCSFYHSGPGENMARGFDNAQDAMWAFYNEYKMYNYSRPGYSAEIGHFAQLVWKETERVGCALVSGTKSCSGNVFVCHYDPPGNVNAPRYFAANVKRPANKQKR